MAPAYRMTHGELQREVTALALRLCLHVHACPMHRNQRGFPDLVIIGRRGVLYRELKVPPDQLTGAQLALGYTLRASRQNWGVWQQEDLKIGTIENEMTAIR